MLRIDDIPQQVANDIQGSALIYTLLRFALPAESDDAYYRGDDGDALIQ